MKRLILGAMAFAVLAGCEQRRLPLGHPPALSATASVQLEPAQKQRVGEVQTVRVGATVVGAEGAQDVRMEFVTPSGDLYQQQVGTLSGSAYDSQPLQFSMPVSGTPIDNANLSGVWHARLYVGDQLVATQDFELKP